MKRIRYVFRSREKKGTSIEEIFLRLAQEQCKNWEQEKYFLQASRSFLGNVRELLRKPPDLYHITGDIYPYAIFLWLSAPVVTTIHDIGRYKELNGWRKWLFGKLWIQWPIFFSSAVTVVSTYTKEDILKHFKVAEHKIQVVPNPYPAHFAYTPKAALAQPPQILQVGTAVHKNMEAVVAALEGLECHLLILGRLSTAQVALLEQRQLSYEAFHALSYEAVYALYQRADIVTFISLHEGFGMPIIEAQAVGRPVLTSTNCSLPEVGGSKAAVYIQDAQDIAAIRKAITQLLASEAQRQELVEAGRENIQRFETSEITANYYRIYEALIS